MTTYGSLFSGVGGFDLGCDAAGWDCAWQVEWDAKARSVLRRHWKNPDHYDDVRTVNGWDVEPVDVITYGFPCQDLSVAGKRAGLDGDRSGLFFEAIRIIREMRETTCEVFPRVAIAENVLGLLNADGGAAMGRCLDALAEVGALAIEWRVLDAQWFGVPQRRRRVFLVAVFDSRVAGCGPVFPEPESLRGDLATRRETGEAIAGTLGGGTPGGGSRPDTDRMTFVPDVVGTLSPGAHPGGANGQDAYTGHLVPAAFVKAKRASTVDDDESWRTDAVSPTLNAFDNGGDSRATVVIPQARLAEYESWTGGAQQDQFVAGDDVAPTLAHASNHHGGHHEPKILTNELGVRRLTPRECERLMGWPDDHTRYAADGMEIADSSRYRMCGNGVAAPVAKYVAECVEAIL